MERRSGGVRLLPSFPLGLLFFRVALGRRAAALAARGLAHGVLGRRAAARCALTTEVAFRCARTGVVPRRPRCCAARLWCLWRCPPRARCTDGLCLGTQFAPRPGRYSRACTTLGFSFESHSSQEMSHLSHKACLARHAASRSIPSGEADRHREDRHSAHGAAGRQFRAIGDDPTLSLASTFTELLTRRRSARSAPPRGSLRGSSEARQSQLLDAGPLTASAGR